MKPLIAIAWLILLFSACKNSNKTDHSVYYTCSMHPQVMQDKPGNCPICGMKLIQAVKTSTPDNDGVQLNEQQMKLGNILTDTIRSGMIGDQMVLTAILTIDQRKVNAVSARVMGRIERLYFKNVGHYSVPRYRCRIIYLLF